MKPKKLLIIDDENEIIDLLADLFSFHDWEIYRANNGLEGLDIVKKHNPSVIISDIQMPDMDGLTFLNRVFSSGRDTPIILLSGYRDAKKMQKAWEACVYDFLDKPFDNDHIVAIVESAREYGVEYVRTARKRFKRIRSAKSA